jgi:hypothetical protein
VNTIVSGVSPALNCGANQLPVMTSLGHNLDSGTGCGVTGAGDLSGVNPLLGPLASNGGPTQTMALLSGSPAIDAGDDGACPSNDQRGVTRPQGSHCDIGAYERVQLFLIHVSVTRHVLDRHKTGVCPGPAASCFLPGAGALVRAFNLDSPAFQATWGTSKPSPKLFAAIFVADVGDVGSCVTGADGLCPVQVQVPGDYLVIARLPTPSGPLYDGHIIAPDDFTPTQDGADASAMLRFMEVVS